MSTQEHHTFGEKLVKYCTNCGHRSDEFRPKARCVSSDEVTDEMIDSFEVAFAAFQRTIEDPQNHSMTRGAIYYGIKAAMNRAKRGEA